jgi:hypothetical protein
MKKKESKEKTSHDEDFSLMMRTFRLGLRVSTSTMSKICGLGVNGWRLYEKDNSNIAKANKKIIQYACTPIGFYNLLHLSVLEGKEKDKYVERVSVFLFELESEEIKFNSANNKNYWRRFL